MKRGRIRERRVQALGLENYAAYIKSAHWISTRERYWRDPDTLKECGLCRVQDNRLALHHKTYENIGAEPLSDLVPLCDKCHQLVHALERRGDLPGLDADLGMLVDKVRAARYRRERGGPPATVATPENVAERKRAERFLHEAKGYLEAARRKGSASGERAALRRIERHEHRLRWLVQHPQRVLSERGVNT